MTQVSVVAPDGGEAIQLGPIQMRILEDGRTTGHRLGVGEITIPPGTAGPPQHRHAEHDEGFYVVSGTARFTVGDSTYDAVPGTLVMVPPGASHTFANPGQEAVFNETSAAGKDVSSAGSAAAATMPPSCFAAMARPG